MVLISKKERQVIAVSPKKLRWPAEQLPARQTGGGVRGRNGIRRCKCPKQSNPPDSKKRQEASRGRRQSLGHHRRPGQGVGCATSGSTCRQWARPPRQRRRGLLQGCGSGRRRRTVATSDN